MMKAEQYYCMVHDLHNINECAIIGSDKVEINYQLSQWNGQ